MNFMPAIRGATLDGYWIEIMNILYFSMLLLAQDWNIGVFFIVAVNVLNEIGISLKIHQHRF